MPKKARQRHIIASMGIKWKYKNSYQICKLLIEYGASENSIERAYKRAIAFEAPQEFLDLLKPDE